jgi:hypothetical protein
MDGVVAGSRVDALFSLTRQDIRQFRARSTLIALGVPEVGVHPMLVLRCWLHPVDDLNLL